MAPRLATSFVVLALVALTAGGCGSSDDSADVTTPIATVTQETTPAIEPTPVVTTPPVPKPTTVTVVVANGAPKGGIKRAKVRKGDKVVLVVRSDVADEVHLHGYDRSAEIEGGSARIAFTASVPGRFEVELERLGVPIAELTVNP